MAGKRLYMVEYIRGKKKGIGVYPVSNHIFHSRAEADKMLKEFGMRSWARVKMFDWR